MENVNIFIKNNVASIGKDVYVTPEIPEKKLNNVITAFHCEDFKDSIIAIQDGTIFGSAKEGFVFTGEKMIHHEHGEFKYSEIESVKYTKDIIVNEKGKEKEEEYIVVSKNGGEYKFEYLYNIDTEKLAVFLNTIITEFDDFKEETQLKAIENMSEEVKAAYLKVIINMTFIDDEKVDEKELSALLLLMTRLKLERDSRFEVREYITNISHDSIRSLIELFDTVKKYSEESLHESIMISLVKDLYNTYLSSKIDYDPKKGKSISDVIDEYSKGFTFIQDNNALFNLSDEKIKLALEVIKTDYENLIGDRDDNAIEKSLKELSAKAAAAGTPLAAIYISGSVVGMSAAGITSGLATLGMGMGMTGGIAVVAVIGVLSYKGMKHLTGANEVDKYKTRELMLHEVLKQTQKTISLIIEDINFIVQKLNDTIVNHAEQTEKIKKLTTMVAQFQGALKSVDSKNKQCQDSVYKLQCPKYLDLQRLQSLTEEPTKKEVFDFISSNYEEKIIENDGNKENKLVLKDNITTDDLDEMAKAFKGLGYFEMSNILAGKANEGLNKVKGLFA